MPVMAVVPSTGNHTVSGVPPRSKQHGSGPGVSSPTFLGGVDVKQRSIQLGDDGDGDMSTGSFCQSVKSSTAKVCELETRSICNGNGCFSACVEGPETFPPFVLLGRCLQKVQQEKATLLLIAPTWCAQPWYPTLLELLVSHPLLLPRRKDLLKDLFNRFHPLNDLQLTAWKVSGDIT